MTSASPHPESHEDGSSEPVPAAMVSSRDGNTVPIQGRAQFTLTVLLMSVALAAVAIRLSMLSWAGVVASALLAAAFLRTLTFAKWHRCALGRPAGRYQLVGVFIWSAMLAVGILGVGLGILGCAGLPLSLLMMPTRSDPAVVPVISAVPAILAMIVVAKNLWPVKPRARSGHSGQDAP